jgi:hypothetical protein
MRGSLLMCLFLQGANIQSQHRPCQVKRGIYLEILKPSVSKSSQNVGYDLETTI